MKKWKLRISDRLSIDPDDDKRSKQIVLELAALSKKLPDIEKDEEEAKERYWIVAEEQRKGNVLGYPEARKKEIQSRLWKVQGEISRPRKELNEKSQRLQFQLHTLIDPLKTEIVTWLDKYIDEVRVLQSARTVAREPRLLDMGAKGEKDITVRIVEHNFSAIQKVVDLLLSFKSEIRGLSGISLEQVLARVKTFENEINRIDIHATEKTEVDEGRWTELRQSGVM